MFLQSCRSRYFLQLSCKRTLASWCNPPDDFLHHQYVIQNVQFLSCSKQTLLSQSAACIMMLNNSRPHTARGKFQKEKGTPKLCIYIYILQLLKKAFFILFNQTKIPAHPHTYKFCVPLDKMLGFQCLK